MSKLSTLGSPGIEVREYDNSLRVDVDPSTTYFVPGFAAQGPVEEVHSIGSMSDFENIYGVPTNDAERYFYHTVKSIIDNTGSSSSVYVSRLPYGAKEGDTVTSAFTLLSYPAVPIIRKNEESDDVFESFKLDSGKESNLETLLSLYEKAKIEESSDTETEEGTEALEESALEGIVPTCSYDLIIDDDYVLDTKTKIVLSGLQIYGADGSLETLPNAQDMASFAGTLKLNYHFLTEKTEGEETIYETGASLVSVGKIAMEWNADKKALVLHFAFAISNEAGKKIGILTMTSTYTGISSTKTHEYCFYTPTDCDAQFSFNDVYEIAASYDGQTFEQMESSVYDTTKFAKDVTYLIGAPITFHISLDQYYRIITGDNFKWSRRPYNMSGVQQEVSDFAPESSSVSGSDNTFGIFEAISHSAFVVINSSRSIINDSFEGFYFGMSDNMFVTPSKDYTYNAIRKVKVTTDTVNLEKEDEKGLMDALTSESDFDTIGESRLGFYLTDNHSGSVSKIMERNITAMDVSSSEYDDTLNMAIFKLSKSVNASATLKLDFNIREKYNAAIGKSRVMSDANASKPISYFVENVTENSSNMVFLVNPYISEKIFVDIDGNLHGKTRIFGKKLVDNLEFYEKDYLINNLSTTTATSDLTSILPIRIARSGIESYKSIIKQAGVTPYFLKKAFNITEQINNESYKHLVMGDALYPFGVYSSVKNTSKIIGNVPAKLERALELVKNDEEYTKIDIIPEAGLGTIYVYSNSPVIVGEATNYGAFDVEEGEGDGTLGDDDATNPKLLFDASLILKGIEDLRSGRSSLTEEASEVIEDYLAVLNTFYNFCNSQTNGGRGDTFFIGDVLRGVLIKGKDTKVTSLYGTKMENNSYDSSDNTNHSFSTSILYPFKHLFDSVVSSYGSTYAQWLKVLDNTSSEKIWVPVSGFVGAMMGRSDVQAGPWLAAAGINRGIIPALDCAFNPNQDQRTDLYKLCINAVPKIPNKGITIFGIRTMSKKASAFDQNTCRRTFLYMENTIKRYMRNYIFEPNNAYTRVQIVNDIEPFLEGIAISGGIYSWSCVCDTSNNTPDVINNGDMVVDIAAAPTRTAENIILNFTANKYTSDIANTEV